MFENQPADVRESWHGCRRIRTIPGIGPVKKKRLLQAFGSLQNIRSQSDEELKKVEGISSKDILHIKNFSI